MPKEEIVQWIDIMKDWMFDNPFHPQFKKAEFAYWVAVGAIATVDSLDNDQYLKDVIDFLT
jgi:hypothetical protein